MSALYSLKRRMDEALNRKVSLKSGAYLVIEPTEAMVVIDVNSGKNVPAKKRSEKENEVTAINLEAAEEISRQMRLRGMSGIIIADFINMEETSSRELVRKRMSELLSEDPVPAHVIDYTRLGLLEMTRKKIEKPIWET